MDDYYNQRFPRPGFQTTQSPLSQAKRRMSAADYPGYNGPERYGDQRIHSDAMANGLSMGKQGVNTQSGTRDGMADVAINMRSQSMMQFNGTSGANRPASLDGFQFSPVTSPSSMMMAPGSIFRNPATANVAAVALNSQQNSPSLDMSLPYMNTTSNYNAIMSSPSTYVPPLSQNARVNLGMSGQFMPQNISVSMDYPDSAMDVVMNDNSNNFGLLTKEQLLQSMMNSNQQQNFMPIMSRDSTRSSQDPGGGNGDQNISESASERRSPVTPASRPSNYRGRDGSNTTTDSRQQSFLPTCPPEHSQIQSNPAYPPNMQTRAQQEDSSQQHQRPPPPPQSQSQSHLSQPPQPQQQRLPKQKQSSQIQAQSQSQFELGMSGRQPYPQHRSQTLQRQPQQSQQPQIQRQESDMSDTHSTPRSQSLGQSQGMQTNYLNMGQHQQWPRQAQPQKFPQAMPMRQPPQGISYANAYSATGFDMMAVLMRVATRANPEIDIGAVDLSCAFVVCDALAHDCPIVYCSENFERLTGYTKHEILGRNCRFLQAPDGKVQAGIKRSYVDDDSVLYLKNMITLLKESQVSLINYRKGGQPFMNLLTLIPISYDTEEIKFFVGLQVDLVEHPNAVTNKNSDGSYTVNYQRGLTMPRYVFSGQEKQNTPMDSGQTIPRDDVSTVLSTIGSGESELSKRILDKVLLENTDDVIFVLSLKGLFLYLSPSCSRVLEYESTELSGTALSSVCHPSDIVPVTRELRDTASSATVNVVFRIRRKHNGYMWFEGSGSLHTEQGKGRKSIIMVGRERSVYTLSKVDILASGGINDNEVWTKLSTAGMFLFVSGTVRQLLDKQPDELVGTSMQALMRPDSRQDFMRILEIARTGKRASCKHDLMNKRGQVLQAFTTIYPGDAIEGKKPTFIIAQTRLLKYSRSTSTSNTWQSHPQLERAATGSALGHGLPASDISGRGGLVRSQSMSLTSPQRFMSTFEAATTFAGQHGLELGRQDFALASEENLFDELKTTRSTSWQFELRQMEKRNRLLAEELQGLLAARKKRKRRKGSGNVEKDCANCHTRVTPEWRRGPSGNRDLCNSCGLRWAKQQGRISPRTNNSQRSAHSFKSDKGGVGSPPHARKSAMVTDEDDQEQSPEAILSDTDEALGVHGVATHSLKAAKVGDSIYPSYTNFGSGSSMPTKIDEGDEEEDDEAD